MTPWHTWEDNIKNHPKEMWYEGAEWIIPAQDGE